MWSYNNPTKIVYGNDSLDRIGEFVRGRKYAVVTYNEPYFTNVVERVTASAGIPAAVINNIVTNPDFETLTRSCQIFGAGGDIDLIVAIGGGSVIDAAKVLAAGNGTFEPVRRFLETGEGREALGAIPIIAIPTTAGTGSEATCWATVWDTVNRKKYSLSDPSLYPEHSLVDPKLMLAMPRSLTISTGLDALSHALESIWNVNANPVSSALAVCASKMVLEVLPELADDLENLEMRGRMAEAAMMAGFAFSNTRTALAHSLSYPITLRHGTPHGIACSFSLPMVMRWVVGSDRVCDAALVQIFGSDLMAGADRLSLFLGKLGVGEKPADHGVTNEEWKTIVQDALAGERGRNFLGDHEAVLAGFKTTITGDTGKWN